MPDIARSNEAAPPLWAQQRDAALASVESNAGSEFVSLAAAFIVAYLRQHGPTSGELVTDAAKAAGIVPHDDRAFGSVYMRLSRAGQIVNAGYARRTKGHGTGGATIWRAT